MAIFTLYICKNTQDYAQGAISVATWDMSLSYGKLPSGYVLLGTVEQEIEVPDIDTKKIFLTHMTDLGRTIRKKQTWDAKYVPHLS